MAKQTIDAAAILALVQQSPELLQSLRAVMGNGSNKAIEVKRAVNSKTNEKYNGLSFAGGGVKPAYVAKAYVEYILANGPAVLKLFD